MSPSTIAGRKSAIRSALTQVPEPVRSQTSIVSATNASQVPRPDPNGEEEQAKAADSTEQVDLRPEDAVHDSLNTPSTVRAEVSSRERRR